MPRPEDFGAVVAVRPEDFGGKPVDSGEDFTKDFLRDKIGGFATGMADVAAGLGKMPLAAGYGLMGMAQHGPAMGKKVMQEAMSDFTPSNLAPEMRDTSGYKAAELFMPSFEPVAQGYGNIAAGISSLQDKINPLSSKTEQQSNVAAGEQGQNMADTSEVGLNASFAAPGLRVPPKPGSMAFFAEKYNPQIQGEASVREILRKQREQDGQSGRPMEQKPVAAIPDMTTDPRFIQDQLSREGVPPEMPGEAPPPVAYPPIEGMETPSIQGAPKFEPTAPPTARDPVTIEGNYERIGEQRPPEQAPLGVADPSWKHNIQDPTRLAEQARQAEIAPRTPTDIPLTSETPLEGSIEAQAALNRPAGIADDAALEPKAPPPPEMVKTGTPEMGQLPFEPYAPGAGGEQARIGGQMAGRFPEEVRPIEKTQEWMRNPERGAILFPFKEGDKGKRIPILGRRDALERQKAPLEADMDHLTQQYRDAKAAGDMGAVRALGPELDATQKALDRIQLDLMSIEKTTSQPKADVIPFGKGPGGKQAGGINLFGKKDPEFEAFKASLPKPLQKYAKSVWEEQKQPPKIDLTPNEHAVDAMKGMRGIDKVVKDWGNNVLPVPEAKAEMLRFPAESKPLEINLGKRTIQPGKLRDAIFNNFEAGARMAAMHTDNPLIRYAAKVVTSTDYFVRQLKISKISDKDTGIKPFTEQLSKQDKQATIEAMQAILDNEGRADISLTGQDGVRGAFIDRWRKDLDDAWTYVNDIRVNVMGKKPLPARANYWPASWPYEFRFDVFDKDGNLLARDGAHNRGEARQIREKYLKEGVTVTEITHRPTKSLKAEIFDLEQLMDLVKDDDVHLKALQDISALAREHAANDVSGQKYHQMGKRKPGETVTGGPGMREWLRKEDPARNAQEAIQNGIRYLEGVYEWGEYQKAAKMMKDILADKELQQHSPAAMSYIQDYWALASGRGTALTKGYDYMMDYFSNATGVGRIEAAQLNRVAKGWFTDIVLTTAGFFGSQLFQFPMMAKVYSKYLKDTYQLEHSEPRAFGLAMWDKHAAPDAKTPLAQGAIKWLNETHRLDSHIFDEMSSLSEKGPLAAAKRAAEVVGEPIAWMDRYTRAEAFLFSLHALTEKGLGKATIKQAYETAWNLTDNMMVNYSLHERPQIFQKAGELGRNLGLFATYPANYISHMAGLGRKAKQALAVLLGASYFYSGLQGFFGTDEVDAFRQGVNEYSAENGLSWMPRIPSAYEMTLKENSKGELSTPTWARLVHYGPLSVASQLDWTKKLGISDPIPDGLTETVAKPAALFGTMLKDTWSFMTAMNNPVKGWKAAHTLTPQGFKAIPEALRTKDGVRLDPQTNKAGYDRNAWDWTARAGGMSSLDEADYRNAGRIVKQRDQFYSKMSESIFKDFLDTGNEKYIARWMEFTGGTKTDFEKRFVTYEVERGMEPQQRALGIPKTPSAGRQFQFRTEGK